MLSRIKNQKIKLLLMCIVCLNLSINSYAGSDALDLFFSKTQTLSTNFKQSIADANGKTIEQSQGRLLIKRPNKFSLIYTRPDQQHYVSDGKTLWVYDVELEQVTISNVDDKLLSSPMLLLTSNKNIRELYHIKETIDYDNPENDIFILSNKIAKDEADKVFSNIQLTFHKLNLIEIKMTDNFEQQTRLSLYDQNNNANIGDKEFSFIIPFDVDVIGTQSP